MSIVRPWPCAVDESGRVWAGVSPRAAYRGTYQNSENKMDHGADALALINKEMVGVSMHSAANATVPCPELLKREHQMAVP